jgi:hypothetical protein
MTKSPCHMFRYAYRMDFDVFYSLTGEGFLERRCMASECFISLSCSIRAVPSYCPTVGIAYDCVT